MNGSLFLSKNKTGYCDFLSHNYDFFLTILRKKVRNGRYKLIIVRRKVKVRIVKEIVTITCFSLNPWQKQASIQMNVKLHGPLFAII